MRSQYARGAGGRTSKQSSTWKLLAIAGFSVGLLFAYLMLASPHGHTYQADSVQTRSNRKQLTATNEAGKVLSSSIKHSKGSAPAPLAPQVKSVEQPPPLVAVTTHDQRHPDNVKEVMKQQSSHDEHKSAVIDALKKQQSDTSEIAKAKPPSPAAKKATAEKEAAEDDISATISKATAKEQMQASGIESSKGKTVHKAVKKAAEGADGSTAAGAAEQKSAVAKTEQAKDAAEDVKETEKATESVKESLQEVAAGATQSASGQKKKKSAYSSDASDASSSTASTKVTVGEFGPGDTIHTLFTSNGSPYQNFQARIMAGTYRLMQKMTGGEKHVALTRILHRTSPDELMDEIPTFRAQPLQPECDKWCWFPVADRANAVQQWLDAVEKDKTLQKAPWLLLLETDYVFIKPLQALGDAYDMKVPGLSFAFDYIYPGNPVVAEMLKEKCPTCDPRTVPNSGPAPVLVRFSDLKAATPMWEELSKWIETHEDAKKRLGWVREMYAWDIAVAANKLNILNQGPPQSTLIAQPPHDHRTNNATMYHYTWGSIFKDAKNTSIEVWKFDKRFYTDAKDALKVPRLPLPPPWREGIRLHDGSVVTQELQDTLADMVSHMNAAIDTLPDLTAKAAAAAAH